VPGATGTGVVNSGATRLRVCEWVLIGADGTNSTATAHAAPRPIQLKPRPGMAVFFDLNHGNFMPHRRWQPEIGRCNGVAASP
jgi:2-polyprenyl-6-methoxyphenol hydroxylase-like FAD-dependent oxidoreductase